jgi:hypothetical protein
MFVFLARQNKLIVAQSLLNDTAREELCSNADALSTSKRSSSLDPGGCLSGDCPTRRRIASLLSNDKIIKLVAEWLIPMLFVHMFRQTLDRAGTHHPNRKIESGCTYSPMGAGGTFSTKKAPPIFALLQQCYSLRLAAFVSHTG